MAYPQPSADQYAIDGYKFFRLNTLLASPGDIYESGQSSNGICIGPDSDIANVMVAYFDQQQPNQMNQAKISPSRSIVGRLDSNNDGSYLPSGRPGRILLWSGDTWNPNFEPPTVSDNNFIILETPTLDVIEYFEEQPSLVPQRNDKTWFYQQLLFPAAVSTTPGSIIVTVPYYGRRFARINVFIPGVFESVPPIDVAVYGTILNLGDGVSNPTTLITSLTDITTDFDVPVNAGTIESTPAIDTPNGGVFDLLTVLVTAHDHTNQPPNGVLIRIITSDTPCPP